MFILIILIIVFCIYKLSKIVPENQDENEYHSKQIKTSDEEVKKLFPAEIENKTILTVYDFDVAGIQYADYESADKLELYDDVTLRIVKNNKVDPEAIGVYDNNNNRIGWMPNIQTMHKHDLFNYLSKDRIVLAKIIDKSYFAEGFTKYPKLKVAYARYSLPHNPKVDAENKPKEKTIISSKDAELYKERIITLLKSAERDTDKLVFDLKNSKMNVSVGQYQILKIKFDGKIQYMLLNTDFNEFSLPENCNLKCSCSTKSEGNLTRVYIEQLNDLNYFENYLIAEFDKAAKNNIIKQESD